MENNSEILNSIEEHKEELKNIKEEFRRMDSKIWLDIKKNSSNISTLYTILGFLDDGKTKYNGMVSKLEKQEVLNQNFDKRIESLNINQTKIITKISIYTGIMSLIVAPIITTLLIKFIVK